MKKTAKKFITSLLASVIVFSATIAFAQSELYGQYTVQLGAFKDKQLARNFAKQLNVPDTGDVGVVEVFSSNDFWFILAYSVYSSPSRAIQSAKDLCLLNNITGCWARSLEEIMELNQVAKQTR